MNLGQNPNSLDSKRASPKLSQVFQTVPNDEQFPSNLDHILTSKLPSQVASNFNESSTLANLIARLLNKSLKSYLYSTIPLATHSLTKDQIFEVSPSRFSWFMGKSMKFIKLWNSLCWVYRFLRIRVLVYTLEPIKLKSKLPFQKSIFEWMVIWNEIKVDFTWILKGCEWVNDSEERVWAQILKQ